MTDLPTLLLPWAGTAEGTHQPNPASWGGGERTPHCREHFPCPHPGWDGAQLQEDKGRWRKGMHSEQNLCTLFHEANCSFPQVTTLILRATLMLKSWPTFAVSESYKCTISQTPPEGEGSVNGRVFPGLPRKPMAEAEAK